MRQFLRLVASRFVDFKAVGELQIGNGKRSTMMSACHDGSRKEMPDADTRHKRLMQNIFRRCVKLCAKIVTREPALWYREDRRSRAGICGIVCGGQVQRTELQYHEQILLGIKGNV